MGVMIVEGEAEGVVLGVNLGRPIVTNGAFATSSSQITLRTCYLNNTAKGTIDVPLTCRTDRSDFNKNMHQNPKRYKTTQTQNHN